MVSTSTAFMTFTITQNSQENQEVRDQRHDLVQNTSVLLNTILSNERFPVDCRGQCLGGSEKSLQESTEQPKCDKTILLRRRLCSWEISKFLSKSSVLNREYCQGIHHDLKNVTFDQKMLIFSRQIDCFTFPAIKNRLGCANPKENKNKICLAFC